MEKTIRINVLIALLILCSISAFGQLPIKKQWYVSWGYNFEAWAPSNISVSQNEIGNNFTLSDVKAHDVPDWETGILNKQLTEPQFNLRVGCFFNDKHTKGLEFSLDHTKYTVTVNQQANMKGKLNGETVDSNVVLAPQYFTYMLHNGANHVMINYVQRIPLLGRLDSGFSVQGILKTGGGIMLPHAENTIMGNDNNVGPKVLSNFFGFGTGKGWWQYGGYTAGIETGIRVAPVKWAYIEVSGKIAYANLSTIPVYEGIARQQLWMAEGIFSLGITW